MAQTGNGRQKGKESYRSTLGILWVVETQVCRTIAIWKSSMLMNMFVRALGSKVGRVKWFAPTAVGRTLRGVLVS